MKLSLLVQRWRCEDARLVANVPELSGEKTIWGLCADELEAALAQQIEMTQQPWTCACGKYGLDEGLIATPGDERHSAAECAVRPTQQAQEPMMPIREHEAVAQAMTVLLAEVDALRAGQAQPLTDEAMEAKARAVFIDPNDCRAALMFGRWVRTQCVAAAESLDVVALRERIAALRNNGRSSRETREWNRCLDTVLKELEAKA